MPRQLLLVIPTLLLAGVLGGCDSSPSSTPTAPSASPSSPSAPPPVPEPTGTQLAGTVADGAWRNLTGAMVEVLNGPNAGLKTSTDSNGGFRLAGAFDETTQFRATKDGYVAAVHSFPSKCDQCNPNWWLHFALDTVGPSADIAGNYSLTFVADCELPAAIRTRTYDATVTARSRPSGGANYYSVTLGGAAFHPGYNEFTLGVSGDYLSGFLGNLHGDPGIVEQLAPTTYLGFEGVPSATIGTSDVSTIIAAFDGGIVYCDGNSEMGATFSCPSNAVVHKRCESKSHQLVLTRR